ncbi:amidase [Ammoniphilus sp. YIM 78166]|uniref:amidase n=1 Tax=Ammoniphilus sp. YIM 78166 TaxID=1644106 RepID=UPI001F0EF739|nr:amidase [Ammoniphilus sp. YIM 78166]
MTMTDLFFHDMTTVSGLIKEKKVSPIELTQLLLERIHRYNPVLNAYIKVMDDEALSQAKELEKEIMEGKLRSPLHGIPIAIKDIIQTKGIVTTAGSKVFEDWIPDEDATVITRLKEAGAILIGKTNLHEFAMGATTENPFYGAAKNPWDLERIPGGSSGGSAVALAAGLCFGALGTDTAGSVRLPSALCGTVGLKPTYGRVSRHGCLPFSWSLDHIGPMTRTVKDSAILLGYMAGYDKKDHSSADLPVDMDWDQPLDHLKGIKLGICYEYFLEGVHPEIEQVFHDAILRLVDLGAEVVVLKLPGIEEAQWAQRIIAQAEAYSFHEPILTHRSELYSEDVKFRLRFGKDVSAFDYLKAQKIRKKFIQDVLQATEEVNLLASPMNHNPAFKIGSVPPEQAINNMFHLSKAPLVSMLGFPALALPCGFISGNMPTGLQLIGKPFKEKELMQVGELYEKSEHWVEFIEKNKAYE